MADVADSEGTIDNGGSDVLAAKSAKSTLARKISNPLSEVKSIDSRRNSPSTAEHKQALQNLNASQADQENIGMVAMKFPLDKVLSAKNAVTIASVDSDSNNDSARSASPVRSFWQDREREQRQNLDLSPSKDDSPIISGRVRNSIFLQSSDSHSSASSVIATTTSSPTTTGISPPPLPPRRTKFTDMNKSKAAESLSLKSVQIEKRSSLMSSIGSIRSKKVTFEMAPPEIHEFEPALDSPTSSISPTTDDEDNDWTMQPANIEDKVDEREETSVPRMPARLSRGGSLRGARPLPALPPKSTPVIKQTEESPEQDLTGQLKRGESVLSSGSEFDVMDIVEGYDEFGSDAGDITQSQSNIVVKSSGAQPENNINLFAEKADLTKIDLIDITEHNYISADEDIHLDFSDSGSSKSEDIEPAMLDIIEAADDDQSLDEKSFHSSHSSLINQDLITTSATMPLSPSTNSFLELCLQENPSLGFDDYLNSESFLKRDWSKSNISAYTRVRAQSDAEIPSPIQTVKSASGARTRPSLLPSEVAELTTNHKNASNDQEELKFLDIPEIENLPSGSRGTMLLDLDLGDLSLDLDQDFDRVVQMQNRGYLLRQNTKIVRARAVSDFLGPNGTSRTANKIIESDQKKGELPPLPVTDFSKFHSQSGFSSPKTEPRVVKVKSMIVDEQDAIADSAGSIGTKMSDVASQHTHPRSIQESLQDPQLTSSAQTQNSSNTDPSDRGRLFVKVLALKDLKIPVEENGDKAFFTITLDNGIHCVTTTNMNLTSNAPIYQEFELVVGQDLEFILTVKARIVEPPAPLPKAILKPTVSATPSPIKKQSKFRLHGLFSAQKKRIIQVEPPPISTLTPSVSIQRTKKSSVLQSMLGPDGSLARSYISFGQLENEIRMSAKILEVPCYSEWTMSGGVKNSVTSPYPIGKIVLQLLFFEKQYENQSIPRSLNACLREISRATDA
ncbi:uncharacterized protein V1516DRAFT_678070 [Lipomyces oligophaga]|uniref:uncharacterized protein n=1 Tax=Lipomyces oligophaga TaxID=45792 RepID=UPI0034CDC963